MGGVGLDRGTTGGGGAPVQAEAPGKVVPRLPLRPEQAHSHLLLLFLVGGQESAVGGGEGGRDKAAASPVGLLALGLEGEVLDADVDDAGGGGGGRGGGEPRQGYLPGGRRGRGLVFQSVLLLRILEVAVEVRLL